MKLRIYISIIFLCVTAAGVSVSCGEGPEHVDKIFTRQGTNLLFPFTSGQKNNDVKFVAYMKNNKSSGLQLEKKGDQLIFQPPHARVPVVWEIYKITKNDKKKLLSEIVSYPWKIRETPQNTSGLITQSVSMKLRIWAFRIPSWFYSWANAINLKINDMNNIDELLAGLASKKQSSGQRDVIIMGHPSAGKTFEEFRKIIKQFPADVGIIVLDAQWLEHVDKKSDYYSAKSTFKIDEVAVESEYSSPPPFYSADVVYYPLKYMTNRVFLVQGEKAEVFSEVVMPDRDRAVILSYIDLSKVLGEDVIYDNYFMSLFIEVSKKPNDFLSLVPDRNLRWLWPSKLENVFESVDFDKPHGCVYLVDESEYANDRPEKWKTKELKQKAMDKFSDRLVILSIKNKSSNTKHKNEVDLNAKKILWGAKVMNRLTRWGVKLKSKEMDINLKGEEK